MSSSNDSSSSEDEIKKVVDSSDDTSSEEEAPSKQAAAKRPSMNGHGSSAVKKAKKEVRIRVLLNGKGGIFKHGRFLTITWYPFGQGFVR